MADEHAGESTPERPDRPERPARTHDRAGVLADLAKFRDRGSRNSELAEGRIEEEHRGVVDDDDDHGDGPAEPKKRKPARRPAGDDDEAAGELRSRKARRPAPREVEPEDETDPDEDRDDERGDPDDGGELDEEMEGDPDDGGEDDEREDDERGDPDDGGEDEEPEDEPAERDPVLDRRSRQLRRQETRFREQMQRDRRAMEEERQTVRNERAQLAADQRSNAEKLARYEKALERAPYDAVGLFAALGVKNTEYDRLARQLWAHTPEALKDPKWQRDAEQAMRAREAQDGVETTAKKLADLEQKLAKRDAEAAEVARGEAIMSSMMALAQKMDGVDLVRRGLKRSPDRYRQRLAEVYVELADRDGKEPSAARVLRVAERRRRKELEDDGVDIATVVKAAPKKPVAAKPVAKKPAPAAVRTREDAPAERTVRDVEQRKDDMLSAIRAAKKAGQLR